MRLLFSGIFVVAVGLIIIFLLDSALDFHALSGYYDLPEIADMSN